MIPRQRSLPIGLTALRWMTQRTASQKTGKNQNTLLTLMPPSLRIGMMRWTGSGSHPWLITQNTKENGNQDRSTTQNIRELGSTQKLITQSITQLMPKELPSTRRTARLDLTCGKLNLAQFLIT